MKLYDYFLYSLTNNNLLKIDWYYTFFTIYIPSKKSNPYYRVTDKLHEVYVDNDWVKLEDTIAPNTPILNIKDTISLSIGKLNNLISNIDTTIGRVIFNKVLVEYNFNNKIPYINKPCSISDLEDIIAENMRTNLITVSEYLTYRDSVTFIKGLSRIVNISATPKNILPPPDIDKYKEEVIKMFNKEYGKDWIKDRVKILEFKELLKEKDKEWLKDDPSNGKLLNKKIKDNARVKMYLTFGDEVGFDKDSGKVTFIPNSLNQQYPTNREQLTAMFNSARSGSYDRGKETQKGGAAAKDLLRSTSSYNITDGDCGSRYGRNIYVNKVNASSLNGRYIVTNNGINKIEDGTKYIGQTISVRSPIYCINQDSSFCSVCCGESMSLLKDGINLSILNISNILLNASLKSMHSNVVNTMDYNILDTIS